MVIPEFCGAIRSEERIVMIQMEADTLTVWITGARRRFINTSAAIEVTGLSAKTEVCVHQDGTERPLPCYEGHSFFGHQVWVTFLGSAALIAFAHEGQRTMTFLADSYGLTVADVHMSRYEPCGLLEHFWDEEFLPALLAEKS